MAIKVNALSHCYLQGTSFEKVALHGISFNIEAGTCLGIAGHSGSGKTTLIQHISGLLIPTSGSVSVNGSPVTASNCRELRRQIGFVYQYPEQTFLEATVYREIAVGLQGRSMSSDEIDTRIREALFLVGLGDEIIDRSPFHLSGGQQRRVAIAGVLAARPEILVFDEPTAGLDPQSRRELRAVLSKLRSKKELTLLVASNSLADIASLADRVMILKDGSVVLEDTTRNVMRNLQALECTGIEVPQIRYFMRELKKKLPDVDDCICTVEEARDELIRVRDLERTRKGKPC